MPFAGSTPVSAGILADRRGLCACDAATYNLSVGSPLVTGSVTRCTFGLAPSVLNVLPVNRVLGSNLPVANIMDSKPIVNIVPFGMCNSIANPTVASATAAALGVLTPMPCIPVTGTPVDLGIAGPARQHADCHDRFQVHVLVGRGHHRDVEPRRHDSSQVAP